MSDTTYDRVRQLAPDENIETGQLWAGVIADGAETITDTVRVKIPDLSDSAVFGPCQWQLVNTVDFPQRGDACLIAFDNTGRPWVIVWQPAEGLTP